MIALFLARNMVVCRTEAVLQTLSPVLTDNQHLGGVDLAETVPIFILISRQGQPCFRGVCDLG